MRIDGQGAPGVGKARGKAAQDGPASEQAGKARQAPNQIQGDAMPADKISQQTSGLLDSISIAMEHFQANQAAFDNEP